MEKGFCKFKTDKVELPPLRENELLKGRAGTITIHADGLYRMRSSQQLIYLIHLAIYQDTKRTSEPSRFGKAVHG